MKIISTDKAPAAIGPYSQGYVVNGFLYASGQVPLDPATGAVVGATSVAAYLFNKIDTNLKTVAVVSGGNVDITTLSRIITKGLQKTGRIAQITTKLQDRAGNLAQLLACVSENGANVLDIDHKREDAKTEVSSCVVTMTLETIGPDHVRKIKEDLQKRGYQLLF